MSLFPRANPDTALVVILPAPNGAEPRRPGPNYMTEEEVSEIYKGPAHPVPPNLPPTKEDSSGEDFDLLADLVARDNVVYIKGVAYFLSSYGDLSNDGTRQALLTRVEVQL